MNAAYRALVEQLPPGTLVPVPREQLLELLGATPDAPAASGSATPPLVDLTVREVARMFGKGVSTIRGWCEGGRFPRAYRASWKEWRIPAGDIAALQAREAEVHRTKAAVTNQAVVTVGRGERRGSAVELGAWRRTSAGQSPTSLGAPGVVDRAEGRV